MAPSVQRLTALALRLRLLPQAAARRPGAGALQLALKDRLAAVRAARAGGPAARAVEQHAWLPVGSQVVVGDEVKVESEKDYESEWPSLHQPGGAGPALYGCARRRPRPPG